MSAVSSQDLHPSAGARFVFEQRDAERPRYRLEIYLPEGRRNGGELVWDAEGKAQLSFDHEPGEADAWIKEGAAKLARVLKRDPKAKLSRWRER